MMVRNDGSGTPPHQPFSNGSSILPPLQCSAGPLDELGNNGLGAAPLVAQRKLDDIEAV